MEEILASIRRIISDDQMLPLSPRANVPPLPPVAGRDRAPALRASPGLPPERAEPFASHEEPTFTYGEPQDLRREATQNLASPSVTIADADHAPHFPTRNHVIALHESLGQVGHRGRGADEVEVMEQNPLPGHHEGDGDGSMPASDAVTPIAAQDAPGRNDASAQPVTGNPVSGHPVSGLDENLISDRTKTSVASSFHQLAATMLMQNFPPVDDIVRELLRPMLKTWLDDNLPVVVERLVRAEIERVSRGVK